MDYEKKYKEALKWMQGLYSGLHGATKEEAEKYFPELKESEDKDEMIRQCLIEHIKYNKDLNWSLFQWFKPDTIISWLEKQGKNKPTDKVEPKFKVGDYIVFNGLILHIDEIVNGYYRTTSIGDGIHNSYDWDIDNAARLWTIQDAMDGDVLVNSSNIFVFHFINDTRLMGYCHVNIDNGRFYDDIGKNECFCLVDAIVTPATKEQRNLLFQKMKEAGYEWDADKKEVKKIEVVSKESEDEKIRKAIKKALQVRCNDSRIISDEPVTLEEALAWLEKQGEHKPFDYENATIQQKDFAPKVEPKFKVGDKVTMKGDNTVYTIGIIAPDKTCWLKHGSREYGWATFDVLKHYVE